MHNSKHRVIRTLQKISPPARKTGGLLSRSKVEVISLTFVVGSEINIFRNDSFCNELGKLYLTAV